MLSFEEYTIIPVRSTLLLKTTKDFTDYLVVIIMMFGKINIKQLITQDIFFLITEL